MTLLFIDSFDHYTSTLQKYDETFNVNGSNANTIGAVGRFGNGMRQGGGTVGANGNYWGRPLGINAPTIITGMAFRWSGNISNGNPVLQLMDAGTLHIDVRFSTTANTLYVTRAGTQLGATGTTVLSPGVWYYIELKVTIADAPDGAIELRVNGVTEVTATGQDTRNAAGAYVNRIRWIYYATSNAGILDRDDIYVCDGVDQSIAEPGSPPNNNFLGDVRVQAHLPNGNGSLTQFVGSDGNSVDNYALVDESPPSTTDYVTGGLNEKETYAFTNLTPTAGTVYGVQVMPFVAKDDAGSRSIKSLVYLATVEAESAASILSLSAGYYPRIFGAKPGAASWTVADVNAAEFGVKVA